MQTNPNVSEGAAPAGGELPYAGLAVPHSHPDRLALAARLRGLDPAPPERCRVLELGCAEANNLAAMAFHLEESRFVGLEASASEVERARETRDRLGLDNLELRRADLLDPGDDLGRFDYVIAHGVLSWVDETRQRHIFALCRDHLEPRGVAYVSYNCGPGWALKSQIRRALLQRVRGAGDQDEMVRRSRELLTLLAESPLRETLYGSLLAEQATAALQQRDQHLLYDYLLPDNRAFYFREVVELAEAHDLAFLSELSLATPHRGIEDTVREGFASTFTDPVEAEELADLLLFRAFRASLFVPRPALDQARDPDEAARDLSDRGSFAGPLHPVSHRLSLEPDVNEVFATAAGVQIAASHPLLKTALLELGKSWPRGLRLEELGRRAELLLELRRVFEPGRRVSSEELDALRRDLLDLHRLGHLELRLREPPVAGEPGRAPRVSALTRLEASRGPHVTNPYHQVIGLDPLTRHLVASLDGSRDVEVLAALLLRHFEAGEVAARDEDGKVLDDDELRRTLPTMVDNALRGLAQAALLV